MLVTWPGWFGKRGLGKPKGRVFMCCLFWEEFQCWRYLLLPKYTFVVTAHIAISQENKSGRCCLPVTDSYRSCSFFLFLSFFSFSFLFLFFPSDAKNDGRELFPISLFAPFSRLAQQTLFWQSLTLPLVSEHLYADTTLQCPPINFSTNTSTCQLSLADNAAWLRPHSVPTASACATGHSLIQLLLWKERLCGCIQLYSVYFNVCRLFTSYLYSTLFYMYTIHFMGSGCAVMTQFKGRY